MATATAHPRKGWDETDVAFHSTEHVEQHCDGNFPPVFKKDKFSSSFAKAAGSL